MADLFRLADYVLWNMGSQKFQGDSPGVFEGQETR